jgi:hypothetical protein
MKRGGAEFAESSAENEIEATLGDYLCVFRYSAFRWNSHFSIPTSISGESSMNPTMILDTRSRSSSPDHEGTL